MALPACEAVKVQIPVALVMSTVLPVIEQAPAAVTLTGRPELAVGATANEVLYAAGLVGAAKVMVCPAACAVTVCTTLVAAL